MLDNYQVLETPTKSPTAGDTVTPACTFAYGPYLTSFNHFLPGRPVPSSLAPRCRAEPGARRRRCCQPSAHFLASRAPRSRAALLAKPSARLTYALCFAASLGAARTLLRAHTELRASSPAGLAVSSPGKQTRRSGAQMSPLPLQGSICFVKRHSFLGLFQAGPPTFFFFFFGEAEAKREKQTLGRVCLQPEALGARSCCWWLNPAVPRQRGSGGCTRGGCTAPLPSTWHCIPPQS